MLTYILARLHHGEEGQTMAEYAVVLAVITVGILIALAALNGGIRGALEGVTNTLKNPGTA